MNKISITQIEHTKKRIANKVFLYSKNVKLLELIRFCYDITISSAVQELLKNFMSLNQKLNDCHDPQERLDELHAFQTEYQDLYLASNNVITGYQCQFLSIDQQLQLDRQFRFLIAQINPDLHNQLSEWELALWQDAEDAFVENDYVRLNELYSAYCRQPNKHKDQLNTIADITKLARRMAFVEEEIDSVMLQQTDYHSNDFYQYLLKQEKTIQDLEDLKLLLHYFTQEESL